MSQFVKIKVKKKETTVNAFQENYVEVNNDKNHKSLPIPRK